jgi:uncharacterized repeat protein (TIGR02543 family)
MFINVSGTWKNITGMFVNVSGTWKRITDGFVNVAGTWKRFFSSALSIQQQVTISQSTNATTFLTTLTGTNYYWSPGPPALTYRFQRSINGGSTWTDLASGSISNPSFGSSNTQSYQLSSTAPNIGVIANVLNYYRFRVEATYGSLSSDSTSASTTIQGPTDVVLSLLSPTFDSISLSWTTSTGANRYLLERSNDNIIWTVLSTPTATSATGITGLTGGNTYYFRVRGITGGSSTNPGYSGNISNILTLPILATPTLSTATSTSGGFTFSITNFSALNGYTLSTSAGTVSRSSGTVTVSGLTANQSATVTVTATRSGYGNSASASRLGTALEAFTVTWNPNGGAFTGGSTSNEVDSGTVGTVTSPSSTPTRSGYTFLYWRDSISGDFLNQVGAGGSWTIANPPGNITFYARWQLNVTTPGAPTNLARSTGSGLAKTFTWAAPTSDGGSAITKYQYSVNGGSTWVDTSSNTSQSYTYSLAGSVSFSVRAVNSAGGGTAASTSFTIPTVTTPTASSITTTSATVSWTSTNQATYSLAIPSAPSTPYTGTTATSRSITGLTASTTYSPTITVSSSTSDTAAASGSFTTSGSVVAPSNVQVTVISSGLDGAFIPGSTLTASYTANGTTPFTSVSYQWQRSTSTSPTGTYSNVGTNASTLSTNSTYNNRYVRCTVTVTNTAGNASGTSPNYFMSDAL